MFHLLVSLWLAVLSASPTFAAETVNGDHVRVSWLAPTRFAPVRTTIGIHFRIDPEWHIYWKNAGDSGAAPKFAFVSKDAAVGPVQWPFPHRMPLGDLTNFGYEKEVAFPLTVDPTGENLRLEVKLEWLVCKVECLPGFGTLSLERPVGPGPAEWRPGHQALLRRFVEKVPAAEASSPYQIARAETMTGDQLKLNIEGASLATPPLEIFPTDGDFLLPSAPERQGDDFLFRERGGRDKPASTGFVLVAGEKSWEFPAVKVSVAAPKAEPVDAATFLVILLSAFLGGVLLNLMPCVFPVLSIKVFSLMKGHSSKRHLAFEGFSYTAGVLVTFLALGAVFLILRAAGASIGWGFQLQSPLIVMGLALLFWLMGLNFLGVFEMGDRLMIWAGRYDTAGSSFATGVLSVFVAAPCTGPFMGTALGSSATLPAAQAMGIFFGLGLGLASPFILLTLVPSLLAKMPKPGAWMERLKQFFAFPLFATVLWLLWVLSRQVGETAWTVGASLMLMISFLIWFAAGRGGWRRGVAWVVAIALLIFAVQAIREVPVPGAPASTESAWIPFDAAAVEKARAEKRPVFIDFTAAWCITCQWNKKSVLETATAQDLFNSNGVLLMRADWTNYDPRITEALSALGRNSVPVYAYYAPGASEPNLLPQLLKMSHIEDLFPKTKEEK